PDEEFGREVADLLRVPDGQLVRGVDEALDHAIVHRECERRVPLAVGRKLSEAAEAIEEVVDDGLREILGIRGGPRHRGILSRWTVPCAVRADAIIRAKTLSCSCRRLS